MFKVCNIANIKIPKNSRCKSHLTSKIFNHEGNIAEKVRLNAGRVNGINYDNVLDKL